jgi:hypothetical protein
MDLRSIDPDQLAGVVEGRTLRDEASSIPSRYEPPDFVVSALQQTSIDCTWEDGDKEREKKLNRYTPGQGNEWGEEDDLRAYLASDNSSDDSEDGEEGGGERKAKASNLRKLLGLASDSEPEQQESDSDEMESSKEESGGEDVDMTTTFIPGKKNLEEKIRSKLQSKEEKELTPWEKYQEKRKQKRRERRQAARAKRKGVVEDEESMEGAGDGEEAEEADDFFVNEQPSKRESAQKTSKGKPETRQALEDENERAPSSKAELELLLAGDDGKSRGELTLTKRTLLFLTFILSR